MRIATLMVFGLALGLIFGAPAGVLKKKMATFYRVYSGICLSGIGLLLAFRYTLKIVTIDLYGPIITGRIVTFLGVALGGFYLPFIAGYAFSVWIISKLLRS